MVKILREDNELKETPLDCIKGATLLSAEDVENLLTQEDRTIGKIYILRTPTPEMHDTVWGVYKDGDYDDTWGVCRAYNVRPVLILSNIDHCGLQIGDIFTFGGHKFKIISNNQAVCSDTIGRCVFRLNDYVDDANDYEKSDIKKYVDKWFLDTYGIERGIKTDEMIEDEQDFGF